MTFQMETIFDNNFTELGYSLLRTAIVCKFLGELVRKLTQSRDDGINMCILFFSVCVS
jgi:hypothetical protein